MINFSKFNDAFDEYDCLVNQEHSYSSFSLHNEAIEVGDEKAPIATSYIETVPPGHGKGREAFDALEFMLTRKASEIGCPIAHMGLNIYGNPKIDYMFEKAGYEYLGKNNYGQRSYKKIFYPQSL